MAGCAAEYRELVLRCLQGLADYLDSLAEDAFDAEACKRGMYTYLNAMHDLHALWRRFTPVERHAQQPWHLRPKCHMLQHVVEDMLDRWGSPKMFWCYMDESYLGNVKTIAASSKHPSTLESTVLAKVQLGSGIRAWEWEEE